MAELNFFTGDELNKQTTDELKDFIEKRNEERGAESQHDPGYLSKSGKKNELVERLVEDQQINTLTNRAIVKSETEHVKVKLGQLVVHEQNERFEEDYYDPELWQAFEQTGDFTSTPRIVESDDQGDYGQLYRIVAGNRSVTTFRRWLQESDEGQEWMEERGYDDVNEVEVDALLRKYHGSEKATQLQELLEIGADNRAQLQPSPINQAKNFEDMLNHGMTQQAISDKTGLYPAQVSQMLKYRKLPEKVQRLIHYGYNSKRFARMPEEHLEKFNIPYTIDEEGNVEVQGISLSNAKAMTNLFPRPSDPNHDQAVMDLEDFFLRDDVVKRAMKTRSDIFEKWLHKEVVKEGIDGVEIPVEEPETAEETQEAASEESTEETQEAASEESAEEKTEKISQELGTQGDDVDTIRETLEVNESSDYTNVEAAQDIRDEKVIELTDDWREKFANALEMNESGSLTAFKALLKMGVLESA